MSGGMLYVVWALLFSALSPLASDLARRLHEREGAARRGGWFVSGLVFSAALLSPLSLYLLWCGQQVFSQEASSAPVLEFAVDRKSNLSIVNSGKVDVEDVVVFVTRYTLAPAEADARGHWGPVGIDDFSTMSRPVTDTKLLKSGRRYDFPLASFSLLVFHKGLPIPIEVMRSVYCLRIVFRSAITKQKQVYYLVTPAARDMPNAWDAYASSGAATGGGYETSLKILEIRKLIRSHQSDLYDDSPTELYRSDGTPRPAGT